MDKQAYQRVDAGEPIKTLNGQATFYFWVQSFILVAYVFETIFVAWYGTHYNIEALVTKEDLIYDKILNISFTCLAREAFMQITWLFFTLFLVGALIAVGNMLVMYAERASWREGKFHTALLCHIRALPAIGRMIQFSFIYAIAVQQAGSTNRYTQYYSSILLGGIPEACWFVHELVRFVVDAMLENSWQPYEWLRSLVRYSMFAFYIAAGVLGWIVVGEVAITTLSAVQSHVNDYSTAIVVMTVVLWILMVAVRITEVCRITPKVDNTELVTWPLYTSDLLVLVFATAIAWTETYQLAFNVPRVFALGC
jgi:hypothetical protein